MDKVYDLNDSKKNEQFVCKHNTVELPKCIQVSNQHSPLEYWAPLT